MDLKKSVQRAARGMGYELRDAKYVPKSHERRIYEYYLRDVGGIDTIFDVGANIGQTATAFQPSFPGVAIHSFEPFADTFRILVQNTAHLPEVRCVQIALGDQDTVMSAVGRSGEDSDVNSLLEDSQRDLAQTGDLPPEEIVIRRGDTYCAEKGIEKIDILKIDTEGFEVRVLDGFGKLLDGSVRAVLSEFCLLENKARQTPLLDLLERLRPRGFELVSVYELRHEADGAFHYGNALFVHKNHLRPDRRW